MTDYKMLLAYVLAIYSFVFFNSSSTTFSIQLGAYTSLPIKSTDLNRLIYNPSCYGVGLISPVSSNNSKFLCTVSILVICHSPI